MELRRDEAEKERERGKRRDRKERQAGKKIEVENWQVSRMTDDGFVGREMG